MICFVTTQPAESCQTRNFACRTSFIKKDLKTTSRPLVQQWHHTTSMRGNVGVAYYIIQAIIHMGGISPHNLVDLYPHLDILLIYSHLGGNTPFHLKNRGATCDPPISAIAALKRRFWPPLKVPANEFLGWDLLRWNLCTFVTGVLLLGDMFPNILTVQFGKAYFVVL